MKEILILKTDTAGGGILSHMADCLAEALKANGQAVEIFSYNDKNMGDIVSYIGRDFDAVIGFHNTLMGLYLDSQKRFLFDLIGKRKFNFWFDHPMTFYEMSQALPSDYCVLTLDRDYRDFVNKYFEAVKEAYFFPPGADMHFESKEKEYFISFLGRYHDYRQRLKELLSIKTPEKYVLFDAFMRMKKHPGESAEKSLRAVLGKRYGDVTDEFFLNWFLRVRLLILTVSGYYREKVVKTLLDAGYRVDVFGADWEKAPFASDPHLVIHDAVSALSGENVYAKSEISLNVMTWHKDSFTERIAGIMLGGAAALSDSTGYLKENYVNEEEILLFDLEHIDRIPDMIEKNKSRLKQISEKGRKKTIENHTWNVRAKELLKLME